MALDSPEQLGNLARPVTGSQGDTDRICKEKDDGDLLFLLPSDQRETVEKRLEA